jgi:predicted ATPase
VLNRLDFNYFKCFERLKLPLGNLTLLSGANASGKSSVLQALVLLHQTMHEHEWSTRLMLNGNVIKLGTVSDVVDKVHGRRAIEMGLWDEALHCHWIFSGDRSEMSMAVDSIVINDAQHKQSKMLRYLIPYKPDDAVSPLAVRIKNLTYITAERVGPREVYSIEDRQVASVVGPAGENAVSVLHWGRDKKVLDGLVLSEAPNTRLRQVEARMQTFFPGCTLMVQQVPQANAVTLGLRTSADTDFHRPVHEGFGLTQALPIVIAALSAAKDDIIMIENPEVHLHPAGQALMGQFLSDVARAGVQVFIETHSDHILNGIRRSVKNKRLSPERIAIHFFKPRSEDGTQVISPVIDSSGNLDTWPDGFFDQFDKDSNYFAGWGE